MSDIEKSKKMKDPMAEAYKIFSDYLSLHGHRKTLERYSILEAALSMHAHFTAESLYNRIKEDFQISLTTVYSTLDLLEKCNLIVRHQVARDKMEFESRQDNDNQVHLVCLQCGAVQEFKYGYIHKLIQNHTFRKFKPMHHAVYIYGLCSKCTAEEERIVKREAALKTNKDKKES